MSKLFRYICIWLVVMLFAYELGSIHRHLHSLECRTGDYITDRDGSWWRDCP